LKSGNQPKNALSQVLGCFSAFVCVPKRISTASERGRSSSRNRPLTQAVLTRCLIFVFNFIVEKSYLFFIFAQFFENGKVFERCYIACDLTA
jgi:hypothetical protein